jgi:hypothetical protein
MTKISALHIRKYWIWINLNENLSSDTTFVKFNGNNKNRAASAWVSSIEYNTKGQPLRQWSETLNYLALHHSMECTLAPNVTADNDNYRSQFNWPHSKNYSVDDITDSCQLLQGLLLSYSLWKPPGKPLTNLWLWSVNTVNMNEILHQGSILDISFIRKINVNIWVNFILMTYV